MFTCGCPPEKPSATVGQVEAVSAEGMEPVAVVNGEVLTRTEFERRINALSPAARSRFASDQARRDFLDDQVQFEILADLAEEKGYGERAEVRHLLKETIVRQMLREEVAKRVSPSDISTAEIEAEYAKNRAQFERPEARRVAIIVNDLKNVVDSVRTDLTGREWTSDLEKINAFRQRSAHHSVETGVQKTGGDVGWIDDPNHAQNKNTERNKVIADEVFKLSQKGDFTPVFEHEGRWYVATFFDRRPEYSREFSDVAADIRERLFRARQKEVRDELLAEMTGDARIEIREEVLKTITKPDTVSAPETDFLRPRTPVRDLKGLRGIPTPSNGDQTKP